MNSIKQCAKCIICLNNKGCAIKCVYCNVCICWDCKSLIAVNKYALMMICSISCLIKRAKVNKLVIDLYNVQVYDSIGIIKNQLEIHKHIEIDNRYKYVVKIYPNSLAKIISEY